MSDNEPRGKQFFFLIRYATTIRDGYMSVFLPCLRYPKIKVFMMALSDSTLTLCVHLLRKSWNTLNATSFKPNSTLSVSRMGTEIVSKAFTRSNKIPIVVILLSKFWTTWLVNSKTASSVDLAFQIPYWFKALRFDISLWISSRSQYSSVMLKGASEKE